MDKETDNIAVEFGRQLLAAGASLITAESCTGGLLAKRVTDVAGSSAWFDRAFISYTNEAKREMLAVNEASIAEYGAVSDAVVREMAAGALAASSAVNSQAQIAIAISGVAGPSGGSEEKPVGTVWFAWAYAGGLSGSGIPAGESLFTERCLFAGDREYIRHQAAEHAMRRVIERLKR